MREFQPIQFKVGFSESSDSVPAEFYEAVVPGAVQLDWANAKGKGPYWFGENWRDYGFAEDMYWHYKAGIYIGDRAGKTPFLSLKGVDYAFDIKINGEMIFSQEGMFTPVYLSLARWVGTNCDLEIIVYPAPKNLERKKGTSSEADSCCKPAFNYGWDWSPRLISLGIWDEAYIEYAPETMLESVEIQTDISDDFTVGMICAAIHVSKPLGTISLALLDAAGKIVSQNTAAAKTKLDLTTKLENPKLWWCAGQGDPYCYTVKVSLLDQNGQITDEITRLTGFRRVRLVMNAGAYEGSEEGLQTQSKFPMTLELNGRIVFAKGSNWVPPELFAGLTGPHTFEPLVRLAKEANMNILRVWGGGYINKDCFYEMCDRAGIMVWQEFPLACNCYPDTDEYLNVLDRESISIIRRLRTHPCLCIWSGGNELFNSWSKMTNQSHSLRLLDKNCYENDRKTPFIFTSPLYGSAHGGYTFMDVKGEEYIARFIDNKDIIAFVEFGCPGAAEPDYVRAMMTEDDFQNMDSAPWYSHHAFDAWAFHETWLNPSDVCYFYGDTGGSTEALLERSHILQSYGYKHFFEEARRQWPRVSMAINWCFNEPWPCIANNSLVSWPDKARAAYYTVRDSLRDQMLSVRLPRLRWQIGEKMQLDIYLLNHTQAEIPADSMTLYLFIGNEKKRLDSFNWETVRPNHVIALGNTQVDLSGLDPGEYQISAESEEQPKLGSIYSFFVHPDLSCPEKADCEK